MNRIENHVSTHDVSINSELEEIRIRAISLGVQLRNRGELNNTRFNLLDAIVKATVALHRELTANGVTDNEQA